jgi:pterin-4a-carbinolamine dehydratase
MGTDITYSESEIRSRLTDGLLHWRLVDGQLVRDYATAHWQASLIAAATIGHIAELAWHHPELTIAWGKVQVRLWTHSVGGITGKDFALAAEIERVMTWRPGSDSPLEGTPDTPEWRYLLPD